MIHFYLPPDDPLRSTLPSTHPDGLLDLDPERDWAAFRRGEHAWILQTCLRLRQAGVDAQLVDALPQMSKESQVLVFHGKHRRLVRQLLRQRGTDADLLLVGVRGDLNPTRIADVEILQNGVHADEELHFGQRRIHVPHWPQAGLDARDPERGTRIEHLAYKGFHRNLHADFHSPAWRDFLNERGLSWDLDSVPFRQEAMPETHWPDYRQVDLVLAVRPPDSALHPKKPATKLINAWRAGTPALLGPEAAYRELRESELDYIEVEGLDDARDAIERLRAEPELYRAMIEHGRRRARDFSFDAVRQHWIRWLVDEAPTLTHAAAPSKRWPPWVRRIARAVM